MTPTDRRDEREGSRTQGALREPRGEARTISCPFCSRRYHLPAALIGPRGARIRCPGCQGRFVLVQDASQPVTPVADPSAPPEVDARPVTAPAVAQSAPHEVDQASPKHAAELAIEVLDALALEAGAQLANAHARGRLFAEFGPRLLEAFDCYRAQAGTGADPAVFRQVLQQRCGVDLGFEPRSFTTSRS